MSAAPKKITKHLKIPYTDYFVMVPLRKGKSSFVHVLFFLRLGYAISQIPHLSLVTDPLLLVN